MQASRSPGQPVRGHTLAQEYPPGVSRWAARLGTPAAGQLRKAEAELRTLVEDDPADVWSRHALGRALERQSRYADALPHLRLAAVMSDDDDHHAAVRRVERRLGERAAG